MSSRLALQLLVDEVIALLVLLFAVREHHLSLSALDYLLELLVALLGSVVFLAIGQALVGLVKRADTVNAMGRLLYIALALLGIFGQNGELSGTWGAIARWSPIGDVMRLLAGVLDRRACGSAPTGGRWWPAPATSWSVGRSASASFSGTRNNRRSSRRPTLPRSWPEAGVPRVRRGRGLFAIERDGEARPHHGGEVHRPHPDPVAAKTDGFTFGGLERALMARVSAFVHSYRVASGFDGCLERLMVRHRADRLAVHHDVEPAPSELSHRRSVHGSLEALLTRSFSLLCSREVTRILEWVECSAVAGR